MTNRPMLLFALFFSLSYSLSLFLLSRPLLLFVFALFSFKNYLVKILLVFLLYKNVNVEKFKCEWYQLFSVVSDGLEDDSKGGNTDRDVQQVSGEEEVVVVAQDGEHEVQQLVDERLKSQLINRKLIKTNSIQLMTNEGKDWKDKYQ